MTEGSSISSLLTLNSFWYATVSAVYLVASRTLPPALLARGEIQLVGATTLKEYRKYIEKDAALERRFSPVTVSEPTEEDTLQILKGIRDKYEAHHNVKITDAALKAADVRLAAFFGPPSETNFGGGLLTGSQSACKSACDAFAEAVKFVAQNPKKI